MRRLIIDIERSPVTGFELFDVIINGEVHERITELQVHSRIKTATIEAIDTLD